MYRDCKKTIRAFREEQLQRLLEIKSQVLEGTESQFALIGGRSLRGRLCPFQMSLMTSSSSSFVYMWNFMPGSTVAS